MALSNGLRAFLQGRFDHGFLFSAAIAAGKQRHVL
jgi:hypothetical protein